MIVTALGVFDLTPDVHIPGMHENDIETGSAELFKSLINDLRWLFSKIQFKTRCVGAVLALTRRMISWWRCHSSVHVNVGRHMIMRFARPPQFATFSHNRLHLLLSIIHNDHCCQICHRLGLHYLQCKPLTLSKASKVCVGSELWHEEFCSPWPCHCWWIEL